MLPLIRGLILITPELRLSDVGAGLEDSPGTADDPGGQGNPGAQVTGPVLMLIAEVGMTLGWS